MMKLASLCVALCVVAVLAGSVVSAYGRGREGHQSDSSPALSSDVIEEVNSVQSTWVAGHNVYFSKWTVAQAKRSMGVKRNRTRAVLPSLKYTPQHIQALPASFDSRTKWPGCIGPVLNQGECGSCWAFGAAEAISDRICLSKNATFVQRAPLDLTTCDSNDDGCEGGDPGSAWQYAQSSGLVSESCYPYGTAEGGPIATCAPQDQPCLPPFQATPSCTSECSNGADWSSDKVFISSVYSLSDVNDIMADIYANGPVEAAFSVYQDFLTYKSGVYQYTTGQLLGGHAIKIIGWGVENGVDYWEVQNSWTTTWGNGGYFKIARGVDECGIEDDVVAGSP